MAYASPERGGQSLNLQGFAQPVAGVVEHYPAGHQVPLHSHPYGHLIYATQGLLLVQASSGQWLVPPTTAVWLRPHVQHSLTATTAVSACGIFIQPNLAGPLPQQDCVLHVTPLVRELIAALVGLDAEAATQQRSRLLGELLLEELKALAPLPLHLPWPEDALMRQICESLVQDPARAVNAEQIASQHALTPKTLHRRFLKSTGMNLGKWRQQMRLMASIQRLLKGVPITSVALESGYESHSAYTVAFKKNFGCPPSEFVLIAKGGALATLP